MSIAPIEWRSLRAQIGGLTAERNRLRERITSAEIMGDYASADRFRYEVYDLDLRIARIRDQMEIRAPLEEETIVALKSIEDTKKSRDLGRITLDGDSYDLPFKVTLEKGPYEVLYEPEEGYEITEPFLKATGKVEIPWISEMGLRRAHIYVEGKGSIIAVYTKLQCRIWEVTRYYSYKRRNTQPSDVRAFEVRVPLLFPADWAESDVAKHENKIIEFLNEIMGVDVWEVLKTRGGSVDWEGVGVVLMALFDTDSRGRSGNWPPGARGYEATEKTEACDLTEPQNVQWEVIDKSGADGRGLYFRGIIRGTKEWTIPKE